MRTIRIALPLGALAALAALAPDARAQTRAAPDPAEWVPADALAYVGVDDLKALAERYRRTAGYQLLSAPNLKGALALYGDVAGKLRKRLAALLDTPPDQLELPAGPLALYLNLPPGGDLEKDAAFGLLLGVGSDPGAAQRYASLVARLREKARGYESLPTERGGIDVFTGGGAEPAGEPADDLAHDEDVNPFEMEPEKLAEWLDGLIDRVFSLEHLPPTLALCLAEGRLIASNSPDEVKRLLRLAGRDESLAASPDYRAIARQFESPGPVRLLLNLPRAVEIARAAAGDDDQTRRVLSALGGESLGSLIAHADFGGEDFDGRFESLLMTRGSPSGLLRILSMKNGPVEPGPAVAADASFYLAINVDVPALLDDIEKLIRQDDPAAADEMRAALEQMPLPSGETINVRREILDHLRGPLSFSLAFLTPYGPESARMLWSIGQRRRELVEKLVALAPPGALMPRDFQGTQVYDAPLGGMTLTATSDALFLGNRAAVEAALQPGGESLAASKVFRDTARRVPREAWLTFFVDSRRFFEAMAGIHAKRDEIQPTMMLNGANALALTLAESVMAPYAESGPEQFREVVRLSAPAIMTCATVPDGIRLTYVQLKPDAKGP